MFDPSKLDLDLDNLDKKEAGTEENQAKEKTSPQPSPLGVEEVATEEIKPVEKKVDILDTADISKEKEEEIKGPTNQAPLLDKEGNGVVEGTAEEKTIFDINITSITDLINIVTKNKYDFFIIEPSEEKVKISFRKNNIEKDVKYVKYPIYTKILLKAKGITKLNTEETEKSQEGKSEIKLKDNTYKLLSKTVPSALGEKLFFKIEKTKAKNLKKKVKKTSLATIAGFLGTILFIALVLGGAFITFVVLNAKTVEDVAFFNSLGVNLNDINTFIETSVGVIFSIIVFIEVILLVIFLFKFALTKKEFKKQRVTKGIISTILLIVTFSTATAWMFIDKKIKELPNWLEESYGNVKIYDNDKLLSEFFDETSAIMPDTTNLIGPVTIKYDLNNFLNKENKNGFKIKKFIWDFGGKEIKETIDPTIIKTFDEVGTYNVSISVIEEDLKGKEIEKSIEGIDSIEISSVIKLEEKTLDDGGKIVKFDASSLRDLGKIDWYFINKDNKEEVPKKAYTGYNFFPKTIFEETLIGLYINRSGKTDENLDKTFIIFPEKESSIGGEIVVKADPVIDLDYTLKVKNPDTEFGNGFIEEFIWTIEGKQIVQKGDPSDPEGSSEIEYSFKKYGEQKIQVELVDSSGSKKVLKDIIKISKTLKLKNKLIFKIDSEKLDNDKLRYEEKTNEYFIKNLKIPTLLKIDASEVEASNFLYYLSKVEWDTNLDGEIDEQGKKLNYKIDTSGNPEILVRYSFQNRKIKDDITVLEEKIYINADKKDAQLDLRITRNSDYAPVSVAFDASRSSIKDKNITKFIFDYGDGNPPEERDAVNPGHKYLKAGDYNVTLTVVTDDGSEYFITKKIVLKPESQKAEIKLSLKKVPIYQGIDFSSENSNGQISNYFWDFGDGETSSMANPTHLYKKSGTYTVKLTLDFKNKNTLSDEVEVTITN